MICLQYASTLPFNHYINASKTFPKHAKCMLHFPAVFCLHARLAGCLRCSCISRLANLMGTSRATRNPETRTARSKVNTSFGLIPIGISQPASSMPSVRQPECRNTESCANTPPGLHYTLGPHAATSTSGFRVSRVRDSKSLALGNPEYRGSDTPDFCHQSTLGSTVSIKSGNRPRDFNVHGIIALATRFADVR
jgi:hypothetical protein